MAKYLKLFNNHSGYTAFTQTEEFVKPNVSHCVQENEVHYNPLVRNDIIRYHASAKLAETTTSTEEGIHTNAFNTEIASHTFENGVGTIVFAEDVTEIGDSAFRKCSGITTVTIPDSVTSIGDYAFNNCSSLTSITIPNNATTIGQRAFVGCNSLPNITIPNSVTSIGNSTFSYCISLTSVTFENDSQITSIGNSTFFQCTGLTSIIIPNSVASIGEDVFANCSGLTSVTIGNGVTSIGQQAFVLCTGLETITSLATTAPTIINDTFRDAKTGGMLYVPTGSTGYDIWMGTGNYYLGKYNWTKVEQ